MELTGRQRETIQGIRDQAIRDGYTQHEANCLEVAMARPGGIAQERAEAVLVAAGYMLPRR